jgi:hypothetical protein
MGAGADLRAACGNNTEGTCQFKPKQKNDNNLPKHLFLTCRDDRSIISFFLLTDLFPVLDQFLFNPPFTG